MTTDQWPFTGLLNHKIKSTVGELGKNYYLILERLVRKTFMNPWKNILRLTRQIYFWEAGSFVISFESQGHRQESLSSVTQSSKWPSVNVTNVPPDLLPQTWQMAPCQNHGVLGVVPHQSRFMLLCYHAWNKYSLLSPPIESNVIDLPTCCLTENKEQKINYYYNWLS